MDATTLVSRIKDYPSLQQDRLEDWNALIQEFPYFTIGRYLQYEKASMADQHPSIYALGLYKQNPILFAEWIHKNGKFLPTEQSAISNTDEAIIALTEPIDTPLVQDPQPVESPISIHLENESQQTESVEQEEKLETALEENMVLPSDILMEIENLPDLPVIPEPEVHYTTHEVVIEDIETIQANAIDEEYEVPSLTALTNKKIIDKAVTDDSQEIDDIVEVEDKSLMVMMSFVDWLNYFKAKTEQEKQEEKEKKALKTAWQKEKLTAIIEEEQEEIPENIFKQAMESISLEESLISESLAALLAKQGKKDKAVDMYKKLSLRNPEKSSYFADLIRDIHTNNI